MGRSRAVRLKMSALVYYYYQYSDTSREWAILAQLPKMTGGHTGQKAGPGTLHPVSLGSHPVHNAPKAPGRVAPPDEGRCLEAQRCWAAGQAISFADASK